MERIVEELAAEMPLEMITDGVWREVADIIGLVNLIKILEVIGGSTIYAPKVDTVTRPIRDMQIKKEFTGYNHNELARRYNLSDRYIRELVGAGIVEGQISLFETEEP